MSKQYADIAAKNYDNGLGPWSKELLRSLVARKKLTKTEYKQITGEDYE